MSIEIPTPKRILESLANEFPMAIKLLLKERHKLPALILLYSSIDTFGSLLRPVQESETNGTFFKQWVDSYMTSLPQVGCTSEELWGARCGLLHTHTASSKLSRQGKVRQIHYWRGNISTEQKLQLNKVKLFVGLDDLVKAFEDGIANFSKSLQNDVELEKRVHHHAAKLLFGISK